MEYTVSKLAKLSGVSPRTLRYYNEIELLVPESTTSAGYRIYGQVQVTRLQQILFYKTMGVPLEDIGKILDNQFFDPLEALNNHYSHLLDKQEQLKRLITTVEKSIEELKGGKTMSDKEKFEGFKDKMIQENEEKYGKEIRENFGDERVDASYVKYKKLSKAGHDKAEKLGIIIIEKLKEAFDDRKTDDDLASEIYGLHKDWIMNYWPEYSVEGHKGLGDMYVADERFKSYYDKEQEGLAEFLRDIIHAQAK